MKNKQPSLLERSLVALGIGNFFMIEEKIDVIWKQRFALKGFLVKGIAHPDQIMQDVKSFQNHSVKEHDMEETHEIDATHRITHHQKIGPAEFESLPGGEIYLREKIAVPYELV